MDTVNNKNEWLTFGETIFEDGLFGSLIVLALLTLFLYLFYKSINSFMKKRAIDNRQSILNIIRSIFIIIIVLTFFSRIKIFAGMAKTIVASSGLFAVIVGIAAQDTIGNLMSGIMVIISKPFVVGDLIKINGEQLIGFVEEITLRHTIIKTYENNRIIVPNNEINKATIENANLIDSSKGNYFIIPVAYTADIDLAVKIIEEECMKHPDFIDTRSPLDIENNIKAVEVRCIEFGPTALVLRCTLNSINSFKGFEMLSDLRFIIKKRFGKAGIEIPFNQTFIKK